MMSAVLRALERSRSISADSHSRALRAKNHGLLDLTPQMGGLPFSTQQGARERYRLNRGWVYAAQHVIAQEAAAQPVNIARPTGMSGQQEPKEALTLTKKLEKQRIISKMPPSLRTRAAGRDLEILFDHPMNAVFDSPNPAQTRSDFVYTFVSNLNLTGWGFVIGGEIDDGSFEFYALPTTWVIPDHSKGLFQEFHIVNPNNPTVKIATLGRENVAFAHVPNPADPLSALAPTQSQIMAIRIDDHILTSQETFFRNGIFPSAIITIGKDPHPEVQSGIRPRLTGVQRRQVIGAIKKAMGGVSNYGNPAIVDGLIDKIERLSATQNEMGWDKSEGSVRRRILSAFGVHPYILGEAVNVGGYAQVANIEKRFCKRVNAFLDMLSTAMSNFMVPLLAETQEDKLLVWWEPCAPVDEQLRWKNLNEARKRGDITRNEIRTELGLVPDDTGGERTRQWSAGDVQSLSFLLGSIQSGAIIREQASSIIQEAYDIPQDRADAMAGVGLPQPEPLPEVIEMAIENSEDDEEDTSSSNNDEGNESGNE